MIRHKYSATTWALGILLGIWTDGGHGQALLIESLSLNGQLVCKGLKPGSMATVEWAPTVNGPWSDSWTNLADLLVPSNGTIRVLVPVFYRVRGEPQCEPPAGMVSIPAGSFQMGDIFTEGKLDELPVHTVYLSAFCVDRTEVTKGFWDEVSSWAIQHGYTFDNPGFGKGPNHPVCNVNWYDCVKWCNARSEKEGRVPAYYTDNAHTQVYRAGQIDLKNEWVKWDAGYRLPTEAEWEKAARGGSEGRRFPYGNTISHAEANYYSWPSYDYDVSPTRTFHPAYAVGDQPYTSPVGSFAPNGYGLYDMVGNVWEWCWDRYGEEYYSLTSLFDPRGPSSGSYRVFRGGSWLYYAGSCRVASRDCRQPNDNYSTVGFRCVLPPAR